MDKNVVLTFDPMLPHGDGRPILRGNVPKSIHSGAARAYEASLAWALKFGLIEAGTKLYKKFQRAGFNTLAALVYPYASSDQLVMITNFVVFLFAYDDISDDRKALLESSALNSELRSLEDRLVEIARGSRPCDSDKPLAHAFADFMNDFRMYASKDWVVRFADDMEDYLLASRLERNDHMSSNIMTPADYIKRRRSFSACRPAFDLGAALLGVNFNAVERSAAARVLATLGNDHVSWVNDLYGVDRDLKQNTASNLLVCLAEHSTKDLSAALDATIKMLNCTYDAFFELQAADCVAAEPDVCLYSRVMHAWIEGSIAWYYHSERYNAH
uniref:Terpene synthase n=1 Tax=Erythrolobus australicus TaxID=1077150 RepID=A0A3S9GVB5_9RHOD|nr:terpene synthase 2 [Erythrolobus australicus]|mmetsp:Transcript_10614/g.28285  ORF Transcript_10614/g.28285 Transcript_10614/m.28285 type:complete len:329 (+) Transcript_10614:89-1075(+)|eukprot:CAMPEP_0185835748 /NCGR_PEP_ID=MMETSP1353-20130828/8394_1 /TAXON_ID=1077150 /ORGANISM="Erythrolobus australicus, Strain CCMP3124" /LENGTH=328 /DNA_ID=CAMNT_0028534429 /DNA_START=36 /DNA_END=1022 /DNA_ORIENTATION=-